MMSQVSHVSKVLSDGGVMYAETDISSLIAEPWNALSSFVLLIPGLLWLSRVKKDFRKDAFLSLCFGLLFLGGLGSALFHAFRSSPLLLKMDVLPMLGLTLCISWYFWNRIISNKLIVLLILAASLSSRMGITYLPVLDAHTKGSLSYLVGGLVIFLPALLFSCYFGFRRSVSLYLSIVFFSLALAFRELDTFTIGFLPMGTHFMWHVFTAAGGYYLSEFILKIQALRDVQPMTENVKEIQPFSMPVLVRPSKEPLRF